MHRISNPASHLQRRAHKSEKTNEQSPGTDVILKRANLAATRPKAAEEGGQVGPAEPGRVPGPLSLGRKVATALLKSVASIPTLI